MMKLPRGIEPHFHPRTESSGVVWGRPSPPALDSRVGLPSRSSRGLLTREGVDDVPGRRGACRTRGRTPSAARPRWIGPSGGTHLHLLGAAIARPQLPVCSGACPGVAPSVPCSRKAAGANGCRSTGRCVEGGCDSSESGRGAAGPAATVRRVRGRDVSGPGRGPGRADMV
jgi:hypothetical protein